MERPPGAHPVPGGPNREEVLAMSDRTARDELIARAKDRAAAPLVDESWGYRIKLDQGEAFVGRWRGETVDEDHDGRRVYLLWDETGHRAFSREYAALGRELDAATPTPGCTIVIVRGGDYQAAQGTGFSFGVIVEPNDAPLPETEAGSPDGEIPF
jgi:hypothetical protein